VNNMITVTRTGDHDRPEWLITINGIRSLAACARDAGRQAGLVFEKVEGDARFSARCRRPAVAPQIEQLKRWPGA